MTPDSFGARYYSPTPGRFLTPDWSASPEAVPYASLSNPQSLNLYSYVLNNPATSADPDGHWCILGFVGTTCSSGTKTAPKEGDDTPPMPGAPPVSLTAAQDAARSTPEFAPGYQGGTHCNAATLCVAEATHGPTAPLAKSNGDAVLADAMAKNLADSPLYKNVSPGEAQTLANEGKLVIGVWYNAGGHGHAFTVRPEGLPGDAPPIGSQPPLANDIGRADTVQGLNYAFKPGAAAQVRYYTPNPGGGR